MTTEIEKFDPSKLMQGVKDRVKATFVSLIPETQWEQLCQREIDNFFHPSEVRTDNKKYYSEFRSVCFEILTEWSKEHLKECLKEYHSEFWKDDGLGNAVAPSQLLKDLMIKHAPEIFGNVFASIAAKVVYDLRNRGY